MRRLIVVACLASLVVGWGSTGSAQETVVETKDFTFEPSTVTVPAGATITFKNTGQAPHTGTAKDGSFDTGNINPGESKSVKPTKGGTIELVCTYHIAQGMVGQIVVQGEGGGAAAVPASPSPSPTASPRPVAQSTEAPLEKQPTEKYLPPLAGALVGLLVVGLGLGYRRTKKKIEESG